MSPSGDPAPSWLRSRPSPIAAPRSTRRRSRRRPPSSSCTVWTASACGTTGEGVLLTLDERRTVAEASARPCRACLSSTPARDHGDTRSLRRTPPGRADAVAVIVPADSASTPMRSPPTPRRRPGLRRLPSTVMRSPRDPATRSRSRSSGASAPRSTPGRAQGQRSPFERVSRTWTWGGRSHRQEPRIRPGWRAVRSETVSGMAAALPEVVRRPSTTRPMRPARAWRPSGRRWRRATSSSPP